MITTTTTLSKIQQSETLRIDVDYHIKKENFTNGTRVIINKNIHGNECECFVGITGTIVLQKKDWYRVILDEQTIYGKTFNFHIDELETI